MFFRILNYVVQRRRIVGWVTLAFFLAALAFALVSGNMYESHALLLPPVEEGTEGVLAAWMTKLNLPSIVAPGSAGEASAAILGDILGSRRLGEMIIDTLSLGEHFKTSNLDEALDELRARTSTTVTSTGLIALSVRDKDPRYAVRIAEAYITGLDSLNRFLQRSRAEQLQQFVSAQLDTYGAELQRLRSEISRFQEKHNIVNIDEQVRGSIDVAAELKVRTIIAEIERDLLREFTNANAGELRRKTAEYNSLARQLRGIVNGDSAGAVFIPLKRLPELAQRYASMQAELAVGERVYSYLSERFEETQMQKARTTPVVQVVDAPNLPEEAAGMSKPLLIAIVTAIGFIWIVAMVAWWGWVRSREKSSDEERALVELEASFRGDITRLRRKLKL